MEMGSKELMILVAMICYLITIVFIGVKVGKKNKNASEFYIGGRGVGPWITAMSAEASDMSGWLLMGLPGLAYATGMADAGWTAIGLAIGTYLNWRLVALRLRHYTEVVNAITIPDYFSSRFHDKNKILMLVSALFILIFFIVYTASGFVACGKVFNSLFGFPYLPSMLVFAAIIVLYTVIGGFVSVATVDFFQGTLMFFVLITIVGISVSTAGGFGAIGEAASAYEGYLGMFTTSNVEAGGIGSPFKIMNILSALAWGLGYMGMPHILLRFMAIRDAAELKKSRRIGTTWVVISLTLAVFIGIVGRVLFPDALTGSDTESIFVLLTKTLMQGGILPIIGGIMLSGVLAAQISTSDSQLLQASSAASQNFYQQVIRPNASEKEVMWAARITVVLVAVAAVFFALNPNSSIFGIVSFAWAGFGAAFAPLILFSLYWKRTNLPGAIAGMIVGGGTVLVWKLVLSPLGGIFSVYELLPAFLFSAAAIVIVSLATKAPDPEIEKEFDEAMARTAASR